MKSVKKAMMTTPPAVLTTPTATPRAGLAAPVRPDVLFWVALRTASTT